jgi:hypothetical protein
MMFGRFRAAHDEFAAEEFFIVQFAHRTFRFVDRLHLHKGKALRTLIMFVSHDLGVLHLADAVEELEQIALGRVERKIPDIEPGSRYFD